VKKDIKTIGPGMRNQMERSFRGQEQMARFVFSGMILKAENKKRRYVLI